MALSVDSGEELSSSEGVVDDMLIVDVGRRYVEPLLVCVEPVGLEAEWGVAENAPSEREEGRVWGRGKLRVVPVSRLTDC